MNSIYSHFRDYRLIFFYYFVYFLFISGEFHCNKQIIVRGKLVNNVYLNEDKLKLEPLLSNAELEEIVKMDLSMANQLPINDIEFRIRTAIYSPF